MLRRAGSRGPIVALLVVFAALAALPAAALEGGTPAKAADPLARATVSIQAIGPVQDGRVRVRECSGVLIAPDLILTAGHCLEEVSGPERIGVFFFDGSAPVPEVRTVRALSRHPAYRRGWENGDGEAEARQKEIAADLGLLRLAAPAPAGYTPMALSFDPGSAQGSSGKLAAAGLSGGGPKARSGTLKTASVTSVRFTKGADRIAFANANGGRACVGDSGGPVAVLDGKTPRIWGVISAVLRPASGCGGRIVVVPVEVKALATMIAGVGGRLQTSVVQ
jgi:hypothetical protein